MKKTDEKSGHNVIACSRPPKRRPLERRTLAPKLTRIHTEGQKSDLQSEVALAKKNLVFFLFLQKSRPKSVTLQFFWISCWSRSGCQSSWLLFHQQPSGTRGSLSSPAKPTRNSALPAKSKRAYGTQEMALDRGLLLSKQQRGVGNDGNSDHYVFASQPPILSP